MQCSQSDEQMHGGGILVVEDDPDILRIITDNLEFDGYQVWSASTGRDAFLMFEQRVPALIILDLSLPDLDGIQVCRLIKKKSSVPIIILTARDRRIDRTLAREAGADGWLAKPFDYPELAARVKACRQCHPNLDWSS